MDLHFEKFSREYFLEYSSWFQDEELNHHLGPMDDAWLDSVLAEDEADGITWAVFDGKEMVGVVEIAFDKLENLPTVIRGIAVKPGRRKQRIGSSILDWLFRQHAQRGNFVHCAFIKESNVVSRGLFEKMGFTIVRPQPDEYGFLEYRRM